MDMTGWLSYKKFADAAQHCVEARDAASEEAVHAAMVSYFATLKTAEALWALEEHKSIQ